MNLPPATHVQLNTRLSLESTYSFKMFRHKQPDCIIQSEVRLYTNIKAP